MLDPAPQISKIIHILNGRRRDDDLELTYTGRVRLSGDEAIVDTITCASASLPLHRVIRGQSFSLDINISYGDMATEFRYSSLPEALIKGLSTTKIWSDLSLRAIILQTDPFSISVALQHDESAINSSTTRRKVPNNYTSDLTAPPGIAVIILEKVELHLRLEDCSSTINTSNNQDVDLLPYSSDLIQSTSFTDISTSHESAIHSQDTRELFLQDRPASSLSQTSSFSPLDHDWKDESNQRKDEKDAASSYPVLERKDSIVRKPFCQDIPDSMLALKLIESVIRVDLLGGREIALLTASNRYLTTTLPALCPLMFSPGYLKALNQHSCLIPTIAYSLSEIQKRIGRCVDPTISSMGAIKLGLWRLAQMQLFNPKASSKLSLLFDRPRTDKVIKETEKMLDDFTEFSEEFQDIEDGGNNEDEELEAFQIEEFFALDMDSYKDYTNFEERDTKKEFVDL